MGKALKIRIPLQLVEGIFVLRANGGCRGGESGRVMLKGKSKDRRRRKKQAQPRATASYWIPSLAMFFPMAPFTMRVPVLPVSHCAVYFFPFFCFSNRSVSSLLQGPVPDPLWNCSGNSSLSCLALYWSSHATLPLRCPQSLARFKVGRANSKHLGA